LSRAKIEDAGLKARRYKCLVGQLNYWLGGFLIQALAAAVGLR